MKICKKTFMCLSKKVTEELKLSSINITFLKLFKYLVICITGNIVVFLSFHATHNHKLNKKL